MPDRPPPRAPPRGSPSPIELRGLPPLDACFPLAAMFLHSPSLCFDRSQELRQRTRTRPTRRPRPPGLGEPTAAQMLDQLEPLAPIAPSRSLCLLPHLAGQLVAVQLDEADQLVERGGLCNRPHSPGGAGAQGACSGAIGRAQGGKEEGHLELFTILLEANDCLPRAKALLRFFFVGNRLSRVARAGESCLEIQIPRIVPCALQWQLSFPDRP